MKNKKIKYDWMENINIIKMNSRRSGRSRKRAGSCCLRRGNLRGVVRKEQEPD